MAPNVDPREHVGRYPSGSAMAASDSRTIRSFYRVAKTYPPGDDEYLTAREKRGDPPAGASEELRRSYDGLSAFDSIDRARATAIKFKGRLGWLIVRFDIPEGSQGHFITPLRTRTRGPRADVGSMGRLKILGKPFVRTLVAGTKGDGRSGSAGRVTLAGTPKSLQTWVMK